MLRTFLKGPRNAALFGKDSFHRTGLDRKLKEDGDIEVSDVSEAQLDVEAVLKEYLRLERELTEKAKDYMENGVCPMSSCRKSSEPWPKSATSESATSRCPIANQIPQAFMHSRFVEEVFADDADMRKNPRHLA